MASSREPPSEPPSRRLSLPGRLFGAGVRSGVKGTRRVAEAAGLDQAAEEAVEDAVVRALESPAAERALERALQSPGVERALVQVLDREMVDRVWQHLLASTEAQQLVERIAEAPEVRAAIDSQGVGLLEDLRDQLRDVARRLDGSAERIVRRLLFRRRRVNDAPQAGAITRVLALAIDIGVLNVGFFLVSALVGLVVTAVAPSGHSDAPVIAIGAGAWLLPGSTYLLAFWSLSGQTPGMRFLGIQIKSRGTRRLGLRCAFRRVVG